MPRAKVRPENRKRAVQACMLCRSSKKRCNGKRPCTNCFRKGVAVLCTFEETSSSTTTVLGGETQVGHLESAGDSIITVRDVPPVLHRPNNPIPSPAVTIGTQVSSPETPHRTHPRLLEDSRGEKVFIGGSASLSFLQYIRDTVSQSLGRSEFSNHAEQNSMFEGVQVSALPVVEVPLSHGQENDFLDLFLSVTPGFFDLFTKQQILATLQRHRTEPSSTKSLDIAIAWAAIAIGAQCAVRDHKNLTISRSYFNEAQKRGFGGMIEDPCLEMVELFLLMAFYMLGACHRNAAFMYIGVAARAAYVLGLHYVYADSKQCTEDNRHNRIEAVWKCLVTLDTIVSSILGRPSATSSQLTRLQTPHGSNNASHPRLSEAVQANYELACLLDQKVQTLYNSEKVTTEGALACLDDLSAWSARLPREVRLASDVPQNERAHERVTGGLHVSCFYYFAVMLVSRPFLVVHLTNRLAKTRFSSETIGVDLVETDIEADVQEIADACLNAATYMVETCMETESHGYLPDNMRVLKAWLFAAGLVLGFDMFTSNQSASEIENAFRNSCKLLRRLSSHSPLAAHYHDILRSLSDAISARRQQARHERRRSNRSIVDRIMAFEPLEMESNGDASFAPNVAADGPVLAQNEGELTEMWTSGAGPEFDFQDMMNEPFLNWDSADFLMWDPFSQELPG